MRDCQVVNLMGAFKKTNESRHSDELKIHHTAGVARGIANSTQQKLLSKQQID
jgi:hypothetical protein